MARLSTSGMYNTFITADIQSLNSPASTVVIDSLAPLPGFTSQRKVLLRATVGAEPVEITVELLDEVFETETISGQKKEDNSGGIS